MGEAAARRLADLPSPPPARKKGWPWTEESSPLPKRMPDGAEWPRISIVTPSFNQGKFVEETLRSVLLQNYPNLEYIVIDGASTDDSVQIIRKYEPFLDFFVSEPDQGHADAVNKGLRRATGSILAFINSDDFYLPGALASVARQFQGGKPADLIYGGCRFVDQASREFIDHKADISSLDEILDYKNVWRANREIVQPETFWRKSIFEKTGAFNTRIPFSFCYEYWCRMLIAGAVFRRMDEDLACFRFHPAQKSQREKDTSFEEYLAMAEPWLWDKSVPLSARKRSELQSEWLYNSKYIPAWAASVKRQESTWRRWLGIGLLCARYPQVLNAQVFRERWRKRLGLAS
jgi:glycosyltransferase involved in cell wall biosynthesis